MTTCDGAGRDGGRQQHGLASLKSRRRHELAPANAQNGSRVAVGAGIFLVSGSEAASRALSPQRGAISRLVIVLDTI